MKALLFVLLLVLPSYAQIISGKLGWEQPNDTTFIVTLSIKTDQSAILGYAGIAFKHYDDYVFPQSVRFLNQFADTNYYKSYAEIIIVSSDADSVSPDKDGWKVSTDYGGNSPYAMTVVDSVTDQMNLVMKAVTNKYGNIVVPPIDNQWVQVAKIYYHVFQTPRWFDMSFAPASSAFVVRDGENNLKLWDIGVLSDLHQNLISTEPVSLRR